MATEYTTTRTRRALTTIKRIWNELDDAQRRLLDVRVGQHTRRH